MICIYHEFLKISVSLQNCVQSFDPSPIILPLFLSKRTSFFEYMVIHKCIQNTFKSIIMYPPFCIHYKLLRFSKGKLIKQIIHAFIQRTKTRKELQFPAPPTRTPTLLHTKGYWPKKPIYKWSLFSSTEMKEEVLRDWESSKHYLKATPPLQQGQFPMTRMLIPNFQLNYVWIFIILDLSTIIEKKGWILDKKKWRIIVNGSKDCTQFWSDVEIFRNAWQIQIIVKFA